MLQLSKSTRISTSVRDGGEVGKKVLASSFVCLLFLCFFFPSDLLQALFCAMSVLLDPH